MNDQEYIEKLEGILNSMLMIVTERSEGVFPTKPIMDKARLLLKERKGEINGTER